MSDFLIESAHAGRDDWRKLGHFRDDLCRRDYGMSAEHVAQDGADRLAAESPGWEFRVVPCEARAS